MPEGKSAVGFAPVTGLGLFPAFLRVQLPLKIARMRNRKPDHIRSSIAPLDINRPLLAKADRVRYWARSAFPGTFAPKLLTRGAGCGTIREDFCLGDIRPSDRSFKRNSQYAKALDDVVKAGDVLTDSLTEDQKELFEDYITAQREVNALTDCETLCVAFKLGAKIMLDVLTDSPMKEI